MLQHITIHGEWWEAPHGQVRRQATLSFYRLTDPITLPDGPVVQRLHWDDRLHQYALIGEWCRVYLVELRKLVPIEEVVFWQNVYGERFTDYHEFLRNRR